MAGMTLDYAVNGYEWHSRESSMTRIIAKESSFSTGQKWKFSTVGKTITIPYCWSGALQLGTVSAPICSIDTYDLSGDVVRFLRAENDPEDLAFVARVLRYVESRDMMALSAVCLSPEIAGKVMAMMPPEPFFGTGYERKPVGPDSEQLDFSDGFEMKITLKRQRGSWRVADCRGRKELISERRQNEGGIDAACSPAEQMPPTSGQPLAGPHPPREPIPLNAPRFDYPCTL